MMSSVNASGPESGRFRHAPKLFAALAALIFLAGLGLRIDGVVFRSLEYDEIWTCATYSSKPLSVIFNDLKTPNNHPLNSLLIKCAGNILGEDVLSIRLPALAAGILLMIAAPLLAFDFSGRRPGAALIALGLCASSGPLIHYSQTARGYELQCLLAALMAWAVIKASSKTERSWRRALFSVVVFVSGALAELTLPTSVMFIFPVFLCFCVFLRPWKISGFKELKDLVRENIWILVSWLALGLFCAGWTAYGFDQYMEGRTAFGESVGSPAGVFHLAAGVILQICAGPALPLCALFLFFRRGFALLALALLFIVLFPFITAPLLSAGGARVYLWTLPFIFAAAAAALSDIPLRRPLEKQLVTALCALAPFLLTTRSLAEWTPVDWRVAFGEIIKKFPSDTYIVFPACDGLSVKMNNMPAVLEENLSRTPAREALLVSADHKNGLSGADIQTQLQSEIRFDPPIKTKTARVGGVDCCVYRLRSVRDSAAVSNIVAASIPRNPVSLCNDVYRAVIEPTIKSWIQINSFFKHTPVIDSQTVTSYFFATDKCPFSRELMTAVEDRCGGAVRFFYLCPVSEEEDICESVTTPK
jgi:hypothetical protein